MLLDAPGWNLIKVEPVHEMSRHYVPSDTGSLGGGWWEGGSDAGDGDVGGRGGGGRAGAEAGGAVGGHVVTVEGAPVISGQ